MPDSLALPGVLMLALAGAAPTPLLAPGAWEVKSTVVELAVPGLPGFIQRMARGRTRAERKRLAAGQGIEALLAPDPKANCHLDAQHVADGRYDQTLTCQQKHGEPTRVVRSGSYDATGFAGRATVDGRSPKGALHIVLDQRAARIGGA